MSLRTTAATRQNEINANMALVATRTLVAEPGTALKESRDGSGGCINVNSLKPDVRESLSPAPVRLGPSRMWGKPVQGLDHFGYVPCFRGAARFDVFEILNESIG